MRALFGGGRMVKIAQSGGSGHVENQIRTEGPKLGQYPPGLKWHQQLTENYGARKLVSRCYEIIGMGKTCNSIRELRDKVAEFCGKEPVQLTLYLPKRKAEEAAD
jgi:hypothetical protein